MFIKVQSEFKWGENIETNLLRVPRIERDATLLRVHIFTKRC